LARVLNEPVIRLGKRAETPARPAGDGTWSDFGLRLASALILAPIALGALWRGGLAWQALVAVAMVGLAAEWSRLAGLQRWNFALFAAVLGAWLLAVLLGWLAGLLALLLFTMVTAWRFGWFAACGIPYIGIGAFSLLWLRLQPQAGLHDTMFLVAVIWATDIGAYMAGRLLGGARLAPRISPGKTWSGSLGGLVLAMLAGTLLGGGGFPLRALAAALLLSLCAQAGDLLESAIKRKCGVKDSGRTIPGHGGLFDRLDGFLAAAPVAVILALLAHHGGSLMLQGVLR
jgi:phosphatidate cytidylyltransferase